MNAEELRQHELLSNAYLRIRELLNAWDTDRGGENRFEVTERKLKLLIEERDNYKDALQQITAIAKDQLITWT